MIGDDNEGGGNSIAGNSGNGIHISGIGVVSAGRGTEGNTIFGNDIGNYFSTELQGSVKLPNLGDGILIITEPMRTRSATAPQAESI